jgi:hypothetical protein
MALTLTPILNQEPFGAHKSRLCTATFDTSYTTGGLDVAVPARGVGISNVLAVMVCDGCSDDGHVARYDHVTKKLLAFYGNYDAVDGPLIEVPNGTNIGTSDVKVLIVGD